MDFVRYAEASARLLNAPLEGPGDLVAILPGREWLHPQVTDRDVATLRRFQKELRPVFDSADAGDVRATIDGLNDAMVRHPVTPRISDHDPDDLHLHVATKSASVAELLIGEALLGLATLVCDLGPTRLGVCSATPCTNVYVDTSPNQSRRYCSERCSSRANVAAYRARQRAESSA
jgi:predicted RNA-binding Zn ribbon-like protein